MPDSVSFDCIQCGKTKPIIKKEGGTGYARTDEGLVCYDCCAERDKQFMRENNKTTLYLAQTPRDPAQSKQSKWEVTNWPGTLRFNAIVRQSDHNFAGKNGRSDAWFMFEGFIWHGVNIGDNQICRCKKTNKKTLSAV